MAYKGKWSSLILSLSLNRSVRLTSAYFVVHPKSLITRRVSGTLCAEFLLFGHSVCKICKKRREAAD